MKVLSRPVPRNPAHRPSTPRTPKGTPNAPPNFRPCPAPTSANSDASPANSDGPLANFGACPAATDTYPGPPEPREPPPLFPIFATHHQLNTLVPPTYFGVSLSLINWHILYHFAWVKVEPPPFMFNDVHLKVPL
ncbi:hypothetical protein H2248_011087 [Termitomyces sp. 'cryptogamus']|nr:hypothetical protein H2248_011087 [Termitomyces sp. 'cryptogamus']